MLTICHVRKAMPLKNSGYHWQMHRSVECQAVMKQWILSVRLRNLHKNSLNRVNSKKSRKVHMLCSSHVVTHFKNIDVEQFHVYSKYSKDLSVLASICGIKELFIYFFIYFISWRLITLQHCSGFCHTLTWISHGFTCIPHPNPPLPPPSPPDSSGSSQ